METFSSISNKWEVSCWQQGGKCIQFVSYLCGSRGKPEETQDSTGWLQTIELNTAFQLQNVTFWLWSTSSKEWSWFNTKFHKILCPPNPSQTLLSSNSSAWKPLLNSLCSWARANYLPKAFKGDRIRVQFKRSKSCLWYPDWNERQLSTFLQQRAP